MVDWRINTIIVFFIFLDLSGLSPYSTTQRLNAMFPLIANAWLKKGTGFSCTFSKMIIDGRLTFSTVSMTTLIFYMSHTSVHTITLRIP